MAVFLQEINPFLCVERYSFILVLKSKEHALLRQEWISGLKFELRDFSHHILLDVLALHIHLLLHTIQTTNNTQHSPISFRAIHSVIYYSYYFKFILAY